MLVDVEDGTCPTCGGQLNVYFADESTLYVECTEFECFDEFNLEIDALGDNPGKYWEPVMENLGNETLER